MGGGEGAVAPRHGDPYQTGGPGGGAAEVRKREIRRRRKEQMKERMRQREGGDEGREGRSELMSLKKD